VAVIAYFDIAKESSHATNEKQLPNADPKGVKIEKTMRDTDSTAKPTAALTPEPTAAPIPKPTAALTPIPKPIAVPKSSPASKIDKVEKIKRIKTKDVSNL
jgi:hypothetical protein